MSISKKLPSHICLVQAYRGIQGKTFAVHISFFLACPRKKQRRAPWQSACFLHLQLSKGRVLLRLFPLKPDVSAHLGQGVKHLTHIYLSAFSANCDELPKARSLPLAGTAVGKNLKDDFLRSPI